MTDIVSGLSALKAAFDIAKELKNATGAYNDAEMRLKISELYSALSEARIELADANEEIHSLKRKVSDLESKLNSSDDLEYRDGVYYRKVPIEGKPNGPFCPGCYEGSSKKLSSMSAVPPDWAFAGRFECNTCKNFVK
ncbi:hypothetical protein LVR30_13925 [Pantoea ananatis]|uniref:hypothetical protein n=1 Tax=Pantoea ananas TaxID=553 RepID=UPI0020258839|nr:hypothetical protein [Pantoea ananatis]URL13338.1 hypothetical protein LVR30_13925 [Pantoea ananatis]